MTGKGRGLTDLLSFTLIAASSATGVAAGPSVTIPDPGTYVVDQAGIVGANRPALENLLHELEQETTAQLKLLTVPSLGGEDVFTFAQRHAELWKVGRSGKDNGALIVVVPKSDGQKGEVWVHTGYGLEPILPDSVCGEFSRDVVVRYMRQGHVAEGIAVLTTTIANRIASAANITLAGAPRNPEPRGRGKVAPGGAVCAGVVPVIVFALVMSALFRRRRHWGRWSGGAWNTIILADVLARMMRPGRRSGWGGSNFGGFGGGFGGFGGSFGGGGRFGGGGGGASW